MPTITLTGDYGYDKYTAGYTNPLAAGTIINAQNASWNLSISRNQNPDADTPVTQGTDSILTHPFIIYSAGTGLVLNGGTINGSVPQTSDWEYTYVHSAGVRLDSAPNAIVANWRMDMVWDGIRFKQASPNWLVDDAYISNARDDAIENDWAVTGTVRDSLFDGVFVGIGLHNSEHTAATGNTITFENVMMRMKSYLYMGDLTHGTFFKVDKDDPDAVPDIRIINTVFAIEDVTPGMHTERQKIAWDNVVESHGNVFLNLSDTPLPADYDLPKSGFTILQGQQARDYWEACKTAWLANHDGVGDAALTALPPLPGTTPTPIPSSASVNIINGTSGSETLTGTAGVDQIGGSGGSDIISGKGGSDILAGGSGKDKFVFDTPLDGSIDRITDFSLVDDYIYLDNAIFTKLGSGSWTSPKRLTDGFMEDRADVKADDFNDYILYDRTTGFLSYDADGNGPGAPLAFAQLSTGLNLSHSDFYVV